MLINFHDQGNARALAVAMEGLDDSWVRAGERLGLMRRAGMLAQRLKLPNQHLEAAEYLARPAPEVIKLHEPITRWLLN